MLQKLLISGIISGVFAGALLSMVQQFYVLPLILEAESYEIKTIQHSHSDQTHNPDQTQQLEWSPEDGNERSLFTLMTNILLGIGFSLLIITLMTATKHSGWQSGLFWGLAGFCVFYLSPSLGLPPELPGSINAKLEHRQLWWVATVLSTAIGFSLLFLNPAMTFKIFGVLFIVIPHFFSTTSTIEAVSSVPVELTNSFIISTTFANIFFWCIIGALNGVLKSRYFESGPLQKTLP